MYVRWLARLGWILLGVIIGALAGSWDEIRFESTVSISDLLQVGATVLLAILVAFLGQKRFSEDRAEKDLLISSIRSASAACHSALGELRVSFAQGKNDLSATTTVLDELGLELIELRNLLNEAGHEEAFQYTTAIYNVFTRFRRTTSGGSFPAEPYTVETYINAKNEGEEILRGLRRLIFVVNRR